MAIRQSPDFQRPIYDVAGLPFDAISLEQAVEKVRQSVLHSEPLFISTPNLNFLISSLKDQEFRTSIFQSDLCLADGMPVVWLAKLAGVPLPGRVAGSDLFEALCAQSAKTIKVFFFGGPQGAALAASIRVNAEADEKRRLGQTPGVICVGFDSPGFGSIDEMSQPDQIQRINESNADFVVVALGAKKGQAWIQRNRAHLNAPVISHLGAVVNMAAGTIDRAPRWMQKTGLEWIWRIKEEPTLWRRYFNDGLALTRIVFLYLFPAVVQRWRVRLSQVFARPSHDLRVETKPDQAVVTLRGVWTETNAQELRDCLAQCTSEGKPVQIVLQGNCRLDACVRGLISLANR